MGRLRGRIEQRRQLRRVGAGAVPAARRVARVVGDVCRPGLGGSGDIEHAHDAHQPSARDVRLLVTLARHEALRHQLIDHRVCHHPARLAVAVHAWTHAVAA
eukprot:scaffold41118_cov57-Phaeocystis_antarctica.AAC.1